MEKGKDIDRGYGLCGDPLYFHDRYARKMYIRQDAKKPTCVSNAVQCRQTNPSSPTTYSLPFFPFHHTLQLLTQCIPHPPLPLPLLTHPLHPTASHDHQPHSPQRSSLLLRPANLAAQAISKPETGRRGRRCDAHFGKEVEIDLITERRISVVL